MPDLAYTLSERRTKLWHRAFITTRNTELDEKTEEWVVAKKSGQTPSIGFVFTGQGAQWAQMGRDLLQFFPWTRSILEELDEVLQTLPSPASWSLISELTEPRTADHLRQPEFSQPLVTALQLCIIAILEEWGIKPRSVVGHSSGEIAAAYSAGLLNRAEAITAAFYRGRAAVIRKDEVESDLGMLAVGLGPEATSKYLENYTGRAWIACFNSPSSVTVSGKKATLEELGKEIKAAGHFARQLQVDLAYHSELMGVIGEEYEKLLISDEKFRPTASSNDEVAMFSSVTKTKKTTPADALYWKTNMVSPVRFDDALKTMLEDENAPNFLIEIGPSGALAGPISQVLKSLPGAIGGSVSYCSSWSRGADAGKSLFDVAGRLFVSGSDINLAIVNQYDGKERTIIDLPNYTWNHSVKYWHENAASKDWRFRKYVVHDLIGSKILGTSWHTPTWRARLNVANVPWLLDHKMGGNAIMPGAGFVTMALEAMYQKHRALLPLDEAAGITGPNDLSYRFRNVRFSRAMVVEEGKDVISLLTLTKVPGSKDWHEFRISSTEEDVVSDHVHGLVRVQDPVDETLEGVDASPLKQPQGTKLWYKSQREAGLDFGPIFQRLTQIEAISGQRSCRTHLSLAPPEGKFSPPSYYPIHPAALDGCFQTPIPANALGERSNVRSVMIPSLIDDLVINKVSINLHEGKAKAESVYSGRGRLDLEKSWLANASVYDTETGELVMRVTGLNYIKLDVAPKPDPHTFHCVSWKPDITFFTQDQMMYLTPKNDSTELDVVIDLIAHKKPALKVLEINLDNADATCLWFNVKDFSARSAYSKYAFASANAKSLVSVETKYGEKDSSSFLSLSPDKHALGLPEDVAYDLAIVKASTSIAHTDIEGAIKNLTPLLNEGAFTLLLKSKDEEKTPSVKSFDEFTDLLDNNSSPPEALSESSEYAEVSSISSAAWDEVAAKNALWSLGKTDATNNPVMQIAVANENSSAYLWRNLSTEKTTSQPKRNLIVVRLADTTPQALPPSLHAILESSGWTITHQTCSLAKHTDGAVILILDELSNPILTQANEKQWGVIKGLVNSGNPLLWVTKGAQYPVTDPDNAMVHGLFRVARHENGMAKLTTLDVQSSTSPATSHAIAQVLGLLKRDNSIETEYMERNGMLYVQRIMPDTTVNNFRHAEVDGLEPIVKDFHGTEAQVQLHAERLGTFQSLTWNETDKGEGSIDAGNIEVEVMAVGVNFKDVAITMGIVPDNEYMIGFECAGIVKTLGPGVEKFKVGDRVCMLKAGSYCNRIRVSVERCHIIPDSMSFEEAATIPSVYLCSLYGMYHLGELKEGQVSQTQHLTKV